MNGLVIGPQSIIGRIMMANSLINQYCNLYEILPKDFKRCSGYWLVLMCLCNRANKKTHVAFPSVARVAKEVHLSEKMARRHMRKLEVDGFIKTVKNAKGGKQGDTRHYKITLPNTVIKELNSIEEKVDSPPMDDFFATVMKERNHSLMKSSTSPVDVSQTIKQPFITYKDINKEFGMGWEYDSNKTYRIGKMIGVEARPGEDNAPFVGRLKEKINQMKT